MSGALIFITGATGFIGSQVVAYSLEAGYRVRLSVRREEQIQKLKEAFSAFSDKLEFTIIPDFTKENAFVDAVADVHQVVHVASPMVGKGDDFQTGYIDPAVTGTLSVLEAAKASPSIKRVLIMSSILALVPIGAISGSPAGPIIVKEHSKNRPHVDMDMKIADGLDGHYVKYHSSKMLAHQATEEWVKKNKPAFPILTFHPSFVTGPSLLQKKPEEIDSVNYFIFNTIRKAELTIPALLVDVRDVADAMVKALSVPVPAFQEFILSGHTTSWDEVATTVQRLYPDSNFQLKPPVRDKPALVAVTVAAEEILGMRWRSVEEVIRGVVDVQLALGA